MPIYEYHCENCHEEIEVIQKLTDASRTECPRCGGESLKKKTSLNSFQLKGSGWYKDGYGGRAAHSTSNNKSKPNQTTGDKNSFSKSTAA